MSNSPAGIRRHPRGTDTGQKLINRPD